MYLNSVYDEIPEYKGFCPNKLALEGLAEKIIPTVERFYDNPEKVFKKIVYEQSDILVGMTYYDNVWSICTKDILMIDFDIKDGFTRKQAFQTVYDYTNFMESHGIRLSFSMYHTDRGVHAFCVSHRISHLSEESQRIMLDMCNDPYYIGFSRITGYCVRISPKVRTTITKIITNTDEITGLITTTSTTTSTLQEGETLQDVVDREFIAKPAASPNIDDETDVAVIIGLGEPSEYILRVLDVHQKLIEWFLYQYRTRLQELTSKRYVPEIDAYIMAPPNNFFDEAKVYVQKTLEDYGLVDINKSLSSSIYQLNFKPTRRYFYNHSLLLYMQYDLVFQYDLYYGIWRICTNYFLMVDLDVKDNFTKLDAIEGLQEFTRTPEGEDMLFWIYETDRGIHAYLMNKEIDHRDPESRDLLLKLSNDINYVTFTGKYSYCSRVGPKIFNDQFQLKTKKEILAEFISRKCFANVCQISGKRNLQPIEKFENMLILQNVMIGYIQSLYTQNFKEMTTLRYYSQINNTVNGPSDRLLNLIREKIIATLGELELSRKDRTYSRVISNFLPVKSERYQDLLPEKLIKSCKNENIEGIMRLVTQYVKPALLERCMKHTFILRGPKFPFVLAQDGRTHMLYMAFYNLCMIDFDIKDGFDKNIVPTVVQRFLNSQKVFTENNRLTKSPMCFKMYETDNGVHAFCVSHRINCDTENAIRILLDTCSDIWYTAFAYVNGFNVRLSPKLVNKKLEYLPVEEVSKDFIQKRGLIVNDKKIVYIGDKNNIDPVLDEITNLIYLTQKFILKQPNLRNRLIAHDPSLNKKVANEVAKIYSNLQTYDPYSNANSWAQVAQTCEYLTLVQPLQ